MNHMHLPLNPTIVPQPTLAPRRRWWWYLAGLAACLLVTILAILGWLYFAITHVPEFYAEMLITEIDTGVQPLAEQATANVKQARQELREEETWELVLQEDEINAWLAYELPRQGKQQWPKDWHDPRVRIEANEILCAVTHQSSMATVISWKIEPRLADQPNEVQIIIHSAHAGALPLPLEKLLEPLQQHMRLNQFRIRWEVAAEGLIAHCTVPKQSPDFPGREITLTTLELQTGQIRVAGTSLPRQKPTP